MIAPHHRTRLLMLAGLAMAIAVFLGASKAFRVPAHRGFGGSILHEPLPAGAFVVIAATLVVSVLVCTLVAGSVRFDAGLFCAAVGLIVISVRSGTVGDVLRLDAGQSGHRPVVFVRLAMELVLLYAILGLAWSVLWLLHRQDFLKADQFRDGVEDTEDSIGARLGALVTQAGSMALLMMLFAQADSKMQALWSVGLSAYLGALLAYHLYPVAPSPWLWAGPLIVGLVGYLLTYFNVGAKDELWKTGELRFPLAPLARALPLDYASVGTAGAILGYWMSRKWYQQRAMETADQSASTPTPVPVRNALAGRPDPRA